jgi:hypothetical protein
MTGKVFVVQRAAYKDTDTGKWVDKFDLSPAAHFGELTYLLPPGNIPKDLTITMSRLEEAMCDFDPEQDFLLPIGDPVAISAAAAVAYDMSGVGQFHVLKWDRRHQQYEAYCIRHVE